MQSGRERPDVSLEPHLFSGVRSAPTPPGGRSDTRAGAQPAGLEPRHLGAELLRGVPLVDDVLRN